MDAVVLDDSLVVPVRGCGEGPHGGFEGSVSSAQSGSHLLERSRSSRPCANVALSPWLLRALPAAPCSSLPGSP